jgi:hypothetical protein
MSLLAGARASIAEGQDTAALTPGSVVGQPQLRAPVELPPGRSPRAAPATVDEHPLPVDGTRWPPRLAVAGTTFLVEASPPDEARMRPRVLTDVLTRTHGRQ